MYEVANVKIFDVSSVLDVGVNVPVQVISSLDDIVVSDPF